MISVNIRTEIEFKYFFVLGTQVNITFQSIFKGNYIFFCSVDTEEFDNLTKARVCVTQLLEYVNETTKRRESARKVIDIQKNLAENDSTQTSMWMQRLKHNSNKIRELEKLHRRKSQTEELDRLIFEKRVWLMKRAKKQELKVCTVSIYKIYYPVINKVLDRKNI